MGVSQEPKKAFAERLQRACDDSTIVPEYGRGRQTSVAQRLKVSQEAARKWFAGEAMPRPTKMKQLAAYLDVDEAWLAFGIKPEMDRDDRRRANRQSSGAVYMVTGLIMLEGGNCAWPGEHDPRSAYVDIYAIMRGTQIALHICVGREVSSGSYELIVPREHNDVRCIGFIPMGVGKFTLIDLPAELIEEHKTRKSGDYSIIVDRRDSRYYTGDSEWPRFKTFGEVL